SPYSLTMWTTFCPTRSLIGISPSAVATSVSPVTHGLLALIRPVFGQGCHSLMVVSNCMPGSPQCQVASAIIFITSRDLYDSNGSPFVTRRVDQSASASSACMNSSVTRTELLEFWKKMDEYAGPSSAEE